MMGYIASVFIGLVLGLVGGGGSILTVPVLVYLFGVDALLATTYSLFVVGTTSFIGAIRYWRQGLISLKTVLFFGVPSILSVFLTRKFLLPAIPSTLGSVGTFMLTKDAFIMLLFALLMVWASVKMIRPSVQTESFNEAGVHYTSLVLQGLFVGLITGLVGAGGGFLIIPVLVNVMKMPMKMAVGTSLLIITINSLSGFVFSLGHYPVQWVLLLSVTGLAIVGILLGTWLSTKVDGQKLKPAFGWLVLVMGMYILLRELI